MKKELEKKSKYLSKILRHDPQSAGIELDDNGWAKVTKILHALEIKKHDLEEIVETNNKKRFEFDTHKMRIRARQGHSIDVDVELQEVIPPATLYHGTASKNELAIMSLGLKKQSRQHVHMSAELDTAKEVGRRHGTPIVLLIDSGKMHADGFKFYKSNNGVYLTEFVPMSYITKSNL